MSHPLSRPRGLLFPAAGVVAAGLLLPEVFLLLQAHDAGWNEVRTVLFRPLSGTLLASTAELAALVTVATAAIGTGAAWCVERTTLPGRRVWAVLLVLPVAMPDFVIGYAWHSLFPGFVRLPAATVVMTLDLFPLVYLPVGAALRRSDPALEESAQTLGLGPVAMFRRVVLPQIWPALLGGGLLVVLALLAATGATVRYSAGAAALATAAAIPVALLAAARRGRAAAALERSTYLIQSVPGMVIALSLVFFATRFVFPLYQTSTLLFFPLALACTRTSAAQAPPRLAEVGRSLGYGPVAVFCRVTLPIIAPGVSAAFCLVFLSAVTELTATLVLVPTGVQTLATQFWAYQSNTAYGAAAPYAAVIVAIAGVPSVVVATWFSRRAGGEPVVLA